MDEWVFRPEDPTILTLAVDARFNKCDFLDDQVWEFSVGQGEPPALTLQTTLGLRARSLRIFPRFGEGDWAYHDPAQFTEPVTVTSYHPNYLRLTCSPLPGLTAVLEYWVPASQIITGRVRLLNTHKITRNVRLEWAVILSPTEQGQYMLPEEREAVSVLVGRTANLETVFFLSGGSQVGSSAFSSLEIPMSLPAESEHSATWVFCAQPVEKSPFKVARQWSTHDWDANIARIERVNDSLYEFHTGNPAWDKAFEFTQKVAYQLFINPGEAGVFPSFVNHRHPDHGYSMAGDGSDYNESWKDHTPLEAYYLARLVLPAAVDLAQGLLLNFLDDQQENGWIGLKSGLLVQRNNLLATPILSSLVWQVYSCTENRPFLEQVFPGLLRFQEAWFFPSQDQDGDGIPEWTRPEQTNFEDHPLFSHYLQQGSGLNIQKIEAPDLCSFLYRECQLLIRIAQEIGQTFAIPELEARAEHLKSAIEASWSEDDHSYHYWDRDTHLTSHGSLLASITGPGESVIHQQFSHPARLQVTIQKPDQSLRRPQVFLHGSSASGTHRIEHIVPEQFNWHSGKGFATSESLYLWVEHVEIIDIQETDQAELYTVDTYHLDQSLFLPLWAGIPDETHRKKLLQHHLLNEKSFLSPAGILPYPVDDPRTEELGSTHQDIHVIWNALICEGLAANQQRSEAAEIMSRLLDAISLNLEREGAFRSRYRQEKGFGSGEKNSLHGLAPIGAFLDVLGIKFVHARRIFIEGTNPFNWPVTVKYKGTTVYKQQDKTTVIFPDGQTVTIKNPAPCLVTLE
jgi:hypothetical protein